MHTARMIREIAGAAMVVACIAGCATQTVEPIRKASAATLSSFDASELKSSIEFSKLVIGLERGSVFGQLSGGLLCIPRPPLIWDAGTASQIEGPLASTIRDTFSKAGIKLAGDPSQLFNVGPDSSGELVVAAKLLKVDMRVCAFAGSEKGSSYAQLERQVFSRSAGAVVMTKTTEGGFEASDAKPPVNWFSNAVGEATKKFLADQDVRRLFATPARKSPAGDARQS